MLLILIMLDDFCLAIFDTIFILHQFVNSFNGACHAFILWLGRPTNWSEVAFDTRLHFGWHFPIFYSLLAIKLLYQIASLVVP